MRISQKLYFTLTGLIVLCVVSFLAVLFLKSQHELHQLSASYGQSLAQQIAQSAAEPLFAQDLLSLNVIIGQLQEAEHLAYAAIVDTSGHSLAEFGSLPKQPGKGHYTVPIQFQSSKAGDAIVAVDPNTVKNAISGSIALLLITTIALLVVGIIIVSGAVKHITHGLQTVTHAFHALAQGKLETRISSNRQDEIGQLMQSFNQLSQGLNERDQLLKPQSIKPTSNQWNSEVPNGHINITHVFVDFSEINRHIDKLSIDDSTKMLNVYNQLVTVAAHHYDCDSCRFDREGIAIRFLASDHQEAANACLDAICASQLTLRLIDRLNQSRFERHLPTIRISIGLHQGSGFASHIEKGALEYTAFLSDVDHDATRLAKLAQKGKIAISTTATETANAGQAIHLSQSQTLPMTDFNGELQFAIIAGVSPQLRKPIQIQADELFQAIYPRVALDHLKQDEATPEELTLVTDPT